MAFMPSHTNGRAQPCQPFPSTIKRQSASRSAARPDMKSA